MNLAIMQPYFFPYIGYFQLINAVDKLVIYDNIKYTKKGWINRNRYLQNGKDADFTIPLKKDSDYLDVRDRVLSVEFNKTKLLNKIKEAYRKAPYFKQAFSFFERILLNNETNLFNYIFFSIKEICKELEVKTKFIVSSDIKIDYSLKSQDKVLAICLELKTSTYINPIGGVELYDKEVFKQNNIDLFFLKTGDIKYNQFNHDYVQNLSILDVMMFNSIEQIKEYLELYALV